MSIPSTLCIAHMQIDHLLRLSASLAAFTFFAAGIVERDFDVALILASGSGAFGLSPISPLSGQILNAGHLWQPATMAIGQIVTGSPFWNG